MPLLMKSGWTILKLSDSSHYIILAQIVTQKLRRKITLKKIANSVAIKKWPLKFNKPRILLSSAGEIKLKLKRRSNLLPKKDRTTTHMTQRRPSMRFEKT